jgi:hypothetical protein
MPGISSLLFTPKTEHPEDTMPLTRAQLRHLAIDQYFLGFNNHDEDAVMGTMADDCIMTFSAADREFEGTASLRAHTREFIETFPTINFHNFQSVIDARPQTIAVRFIVHLVDQNGEELVMNNCNFFKVNRTGLFTEVAIFNSGKLDKGFRAGNTTDASW